jgi:glutaconate CoA-transferase subunit A
MEEAIRTHVEPGRSLYVTGFTHLIDYAAAHEIIRQGIRELRLWRMTPDVVYDQLVAAGAAAELFFSYLGNPGVGRLHAIDQQLSSGELAYQELTHGAMVAGLRAGAARAPFAVAEAAWKSDLSRTGDLIRSVRSPYDDREVGVVPALRPDIAIVHVQRCDPAGNGQVWGSTGELAVVAFAADRVILTAEEIVSEEVVRRDPSRTIVPGFCVDAVVHEPWASHPSFAQGLYARDNAFYREWDEISRSAARREEYLVEWVRGKRDRAEYVDALGDRAATLAAVGEAWTEPLNYGSLDALARAQEAELDAR